MPMNYVREMVTDWIAANRAYTSSKQLLNPEWFAKAAPHMQLHSETRRRVVLVLEEMKKNGLQFSESIIDCFRSNESKES
jgi:hypothetical protein